MTGKGVLCVVGNELGPGYRSALQEAALVTSLQMFNLLVERAAQLLRDQHNRGLMYRLIVSDDVNCLLPAIKVGIRHFYSS